jgi:hypothetical protein
MEEIDSIKSSEINPKNPQDKKCAPNINFEDGSCIPLSVLSEMALAYNEDNSKNQIKLYRTLETLNPKKYKKYLLKNFQNRINQCGTQRCWTEQKFVKRMRKNMQEELKKFVFRPSGPEGKFEWLNTMNIQGSLLQYERLYPEFKFLGAVPIDFDEFDVFGIKNLNFNDLLKNGKSKLGVVFNLDKHDEPGSHWVALYGNIKSGQIYFFDSYGIRPDPRIRKLMRRISKFCQDELQIKNPDADFNHERHQYENSECGVYSINFIIRMLEGESFKKIEASKTPDDKINKLREVLFIKSK